MFNYNVEKNSSVICRANIIIQLLTSPVKPVFLTSAVFRKMASIDKTG